MSTDKLKPNDDIAWLVKKSMLHPSFIDFDNKVMQRVLLLNTSKKTIRKNLKLSWLFLIFSFLLFPLSYFLIFKRLNFSFIAELGINIEAHSQMFYPAGVILFTIILLLQVDNLYRLTNKQKLV